MKQHTFQVPGQHPVTLKVYKTEFRVQYGKNTKRCQTYGEAARELGRCLMHALACNGVMDDSRETNTMRAVLDD